MMLQEVEDVPDLPEVTDVETPKDTSLSGQAKTLAEDFGGGLMAATDMAASIPGLVGATGAALRNAVPIGDTATTGRSPTQHVEEVMQSANEGNPLNYLPDNYLALRQSHGYEVANEAITKVFKGITQGLGNIAAGGAHLLGRDEVASTIGEWTDAVAQVSLLAAGFKGGKGVNPGTLEFRKANEPIRPTSAPQAERTGFPLDYEAGQKRDIEKSGTRDTTLTDTEIPTVPEFSEYNTAEGAPVYNRELSPGYQYKNKAITDPLNTVESRRGSDMPGIDFTTFELEDPKQLDHLVATLGNLGVKADVNEARTLAAQMKDKAALADEQAKPMAKTITKRIKALAMRVRDIVDGYRDILASPMFNAVELVDTRLMELFRNTDRLTNPKGLNQFIEKETSVMNNGINKGLPLLYYPSEGRIVQANGNTRRGVAAKHGMMEIPAYVRVMEGAVPPEYQRTAVSLPGLKWEGKRQGQIVRPSEIGLPSRTLNEGSFDTRIKYAPDPSVAAIKIPSGHFQNNYLFDAMHNSMPSSGVRKGLEIVRDRSLSPWFRQVAKLLMEETDFNPNFGIRTTPWEEGHEGSLGVFWRNAYKMEIHKSAVGNEYVFIHESIHGRTQALIDMFLTGKLERSHPAYEPTRRIVELWKELTNSSEEHFFAAWPSKGYPAHKSPMYRVFEEYGLKNAHEFVAEAFTNPEFQNLLKQIELPSRFNKEGFSYYWDAFLTALGQIISIKRSDNNYLRATLEAGAEMMRMSTTTDRMYYRSKLGFIPEDWTDRGISVKDSGSFMTSMIDQKKTAGVDRRSLHEVVKESGLSADNITDLDTGSRGNLFEMLWGGAKLLGRNLADARTIDYLNKSIPGAGALITNISGRVFLADRWVKSSIEEAMKGAQFAAHKWDPRGFVHRLGSMDGIDPIFKDLGSKDGREMLEHWLPKVGKKEIERSDFPNDKQWNAAQIIRNHLDKAYDVVNNLRKQLGKPEIDRLLGYFPASREIGDYRVTIKSADGMVRDLTTFKRSSPLHMLDPLYDAQKYIKKMRELFPDSTVSDAFHIDKTKLHDLDGNVLTELDRILSRKETNFEVWSEGERINNQNHSLTRLIQKAKSEHFTRMGMGGHLLTRKTTQGISGFLGSDFDPVKAREGIQQYFEYIYNYAGNLHKGIIEKELNDMTLPTADGEGKPLSQAAPHLEDYLHQFLDKAKGAKSSLDMSEQLFLGEFTKRIGEGAGAPTRAVTKLSRFAMVMYLFKVPFFASQPFQTFNALPHLVDMGHSLPEAAGHFLAGWSRAILPTAADRAVVNWAVKKEYLDPTTAHIMDETNTAVPTRLFLRTSGLVERELVRIPALLAFEHALRSTIKDPETRYEAAAEKMAYSMSMTNRSNSPLVWEKLGIIGQSARQLKSYSTNIWGQFAYFAQKAGVDHDFRPLATFMSTGALIGGVKGIIGVAEATAAITAWNYMTNGNVRTPEEWMLTSPHVDKLLGKGKDAATYGLASTAAGIDISNQVGNPSGFSQFDIIPAKFAIAAAKQNLEYVVAAAQSQLTDAIRLKTWLVNTPTAAHEAIRNWFASPGGPVPNPNLNMQGNYWRDKDAVLKSSITGAKTVPETREDSLQRFFKQHEQRVANDRAQSQNSMVDEMLKGEMIKPDQIENYITQGGNPQTLASDLKKTLVDRMRPAILNSVLNKSKSTTQVQKLKDIGPYLSNQSSGNNDLPEVEDVPQKAGVNPSSTGDYRKPATYSDTTPPAGSIRGWNWPAEGPGTMDYPKSPKTETADKMPVKKSNTRPTRRNM